MEQTGSASNATERKEPDSDAMPASTARGHGEPNITDALARIESKLSGVTTTLKSDMAILTNELRNVKDSLPLDMGIINSRLEAVELRSKRIEDNLDKHHANVDPNCTVIMFNVATLQDESSRSLSDNVEHVISDGLQLPGVEVVAVKRLPVRAGDNGGRADRPPGVIVELVSVAMKVEVLRQKRSLNSRRAYKHISIKSAKSHAERLIEKNFKTLLDELQLSDQFRFTAHGRMYKRMYKLSDTVDDEAAGDDVVDDNGDGRQQNGTHGRGNGRRGTNRGGQQRGRRGGGTRGGVRHSQDQSRRNGPA